MKYSIRRIRPQNYGGNYMDLEEIHDCEKCHGKIVMISSDILGNTYCGYCNQRVDYRPFFKGGKTNGRSNKFDG